MMAKTPRKLLSRSHSLSTAEVVMHHYNLRNGHARNPQWDSAGCSYQTRSGQKLFDLEDLLRHTSLSVEDIENDDDIGLGNGYVDDCDYHYSMGETSTARRPTDIDLSSVKYRKSRSAPPSATQSMDMELLEDIYWAQLKITQVGQGQITQIF